MPKKLWFAGVLLLVLLVSGGGFAYTYNNRALTLGVSEPSGDIATVSKAVSQPDWGSLISQTATLSGDVPTGDLYNISPQPGYSGDLVVKASLTNTNALIKAYRYLNIKLYLENSEEAGSTPDYRVLTLDNGVATFSLTGNGSVPSPVSWTQTTQADFEAGTLTNLDTTSSPGDVKLASATSIIASDDFESGGWSGGSGWLYPWWRHAGLADVTDDDGPYQGSYHLLVRGTNGYAERALNLVGKTNVRLQFWAKADSLESGDVASARVSPDDTNWTTVRSWTDGDDDDTYRFYDIDLSAFPMSGEFRIAFNGIGMSGGNDFLYVDNVRLVWGTQYQLSGSLISQARDGGSNADFGTIGFTITEPSGTDIKFQLRSAATSGGLASAVWYGPTGTGDYYTASNTAINPVHDGDRWFQFRAVFSGNGSRTPTLSDVTITYTIGGGGGLSDSRLSVVGGSYHKVSGDSEDWASGWSIIPEIYGEVVQR
ncbi:MAG: hypothetical protein V1823_01755 [Chloroflexota bacterium]